MSPASHAAPDARADEVGDGATYEWVRPIDVRRAVLSVLIRRAEPMAHREVVEELARQGVDVTSRRVSDIVRYQRQRGRVERAERVCSDSRIDGTRPQPSAR